MKLGRGLWGSVRRRTSAGGLTPPSAANPAPTAPDPVRFLHQRYTAEPPTLPPARLSPLPPPFVDDEAFAAALRGAAGQLRAGGVGVVYLCHGTFAGTDAAGLLVEL